MELAKYAKELGLSVWAYTGFTYEELLTLPKQRELLNYIDVLIDGKFILEQKSLAIKFRGSTNQRIIDVVKSLKQGRTVVIRKYDKTENTKKVKSYMFV